MNFGRTDGTNNKGTSYFCLVISCQPSAETDFGENQNHERERGEKKCKFLCSSLIRTSAFTRAPLTFLIALMLKHAGQEQVRGRHHSHQLSHILSTMWKQETGSCHSPAWLPFSALLVKGVWLNWLRKMCSTVVLQTKRKLTPPQCHGQRWYGFVSSQTSQ